jgi:DNA-binding winged helix-turn-helix (wHTH) protein
MATWLDVSRKTVVPKMADEPVSSPLIRIGPLVLDPDNLELTDGDRTDVLRPLPAALLFHLLRQRHRIVPKEELLQVLWPETSVSDAALASAVRDLRRLLHDDGENQHIVRTFRGRGYRLVAPVEFDARRPTSEHTIGSSRPTPPLVPEFVGRELEIARFDRICADAAEGRGGVLLIESDSGGGRTALVDQFARRANGAIWLGVSCKDEGWTPRYDTITRLVVDLERAVGSDLVDEWARADRDVTEILPDVESRRSEPRAQVRIEIVAAALRRLLDRVRALSPVVVAIDDIHFIDLASLEVLCTGALRNVLLVATVDPLLAPRAIWMGIGALFSERNRMTLAGLTAAEIAVLARGLPQATHDPNWSMRLRDRTAGQPADVLAVLRELGTAERTSDHATPLLPQAVLDRLARRFDRLSRNARAVVIACSAMPPGASLDAILALAGCRPDHTTDSDPIEEGVRAGLLRVNDRPLGVALNGQFARHVVLAQLSVERRRMLERQAMELLREAD